MALESDGQGENGPGNSNKVQPDVPRLDDSQEQDSLVSSDDVRVPADSIVVEEKPSDTGGAVPEIQSQVEEVGPQPSDKTEPGTEDNEKAEVFPSAESTGAPPTTESPAEDETSEAPESRLETALQAGVEQILDAFERKLAYDASKQIQVDRLHEELQKYRTDLVSRAALPLIRGVIHHYDQIGKLVEALRRKPREELSPEKFFKLLDEIQEDVEILLGQNGVATYREPSGPFEPRRQRVIKKVDTTEQELAGTVARSIRPGFERGSEILEKERVATYEYKAPPAETLEGDSVAVADGEGSPTEITKEGG